jgi:undecaprenyl-diphosphatase
LRLSKGPAEILIGLFVLTALLFGFVELSETIRQEHAPATDTRILLAFRDGQDLADPRGPPWVARSVRDLTALGSWVVTGLLTMIVAGYLLLQRRPRSAALLVVAVAGGVIIGTLLKDLYERPRPDVVPHLVEVLSESFPSGHSVVAAVVYPTLGAVLARVTESARVRIYLVAVGVLLALVVGVTRVYLGVHYPSDVLAGWTVGFAWALACWLAVRALQQRDRVVEPGVDPAPGARAEAS